MDMGTLGAVVAAVAVCLLVVLILLWRQNRQYRGLGWWALGQGFMVLTFVITATATTRSWVPLVVVTTSATIASLLCMYVGIVRFLGRPVPRVWPWVYLGVCVAVLAHFVLFEPVVGLRRTFLYAALAGVQVMMVRALWVYRREYMRRSGTFLRLVFGIAAPYYAGLALLTVRELSPGQRTLEVGTAPAFAFFGAVTLMTMWTYGLSLMVGEHLRYDLAEDRSNLQEIFRASPDATMISRLEDGLIQDVNEGFTRLLGIDRELAVGRRAGDLGLWSDPEDRIRLQAELAAGPVDEWQTRFVRADGAAIEVAMSARLLRLAGEPYVITVSRDITERKRWETELHRQATTDHLTGVLNRRAFLDAVSQGLSDCRARQVPLALAVLDLDEFKLLNDAYGHAAGDSAVRTFALIAGGVLRDGDAIGRLGGDEFAIMLPGMTVAEGAAVVEQVRQQIARCPLTVAGRPVRLSFSAGVAGAEGWPSLDELFAKADSGLYRAKEQGRDQVVAA